MEDLYQINQRIRDLMAFLGFPDNVDGFYKKFLGDGPSERLRLVFKDKNPIKLDFLIEITKNIGERAGHKVNHHWLLTGQGLMFLEEKHTAATNLDEAAVNEQEETLKSLSNSVATLTRANLIHAQTIAQLLSREVVKQG